MSKNAVFSEASPPIPSSVPSPTLQSDPLTQGIPASMMQSATDRAKEEFGFEIEAKPIPLPSLGLVYSPPDPLAGAETVMVKQMTAREEDILMNVALHKQGTVISRLIESCLLDKRINVANMISGDRNTLLVAIRVLGYGEMFSPEIACPSCEVKTRWDVNLDTTLEIKTLDLSTVDQVSPGKNEFRFHLPSSKKDITFQFLTGQIEERLFQEAETRKKRGLPPQNPSSTSLMYQIVSIDGNTDRGYINKFCQYMPAKDSLALRQHIRATEPGISNKAEFSCPSCGFQEVIAVPLLNAEFFWPDAR